MNAKKLKQSRKKQGYYERQKHVTTRNKAQAKARIERRKKQYPQDPENILRIKREKSAARQHRKAYRLAVAEAARQERERKAA